MANYGEGRARQRTCRHGALHRPRWTLFAIIPPTVGLMIWYLQYCRHPDRPRCAPGARPARRWRQVGLHMHRYALLSSHRSSFFRRSVFCSAPHTWLVMRSAAAGTASPASAAQPSAGATHPAGATHLAGGAAAGIPDLGAMVCLHDYQSCRIYMSNSRCARS